MRHMASLLTLIALGACDSETNLAADLGLEPSQNPLPVRNETVTDLIVQTVTPSVEVLYMVDNSCSMGDDQDELVEFFPSFMRWFLGSGLDYHIGVVSSDILERAESGKLQGAFGKKWISEDDANQIPMFTSMAVLGNRGLFPERGLAGIYYSMEQPQAVQFNEGFFRERSAIHTICVSDEQDFSDRNDSRINNQILLSAPEFTNWYDGLKRSADDRTFSSIEAPPGNCSGFGSGCGQPYSAVSRVIGGVTWNIDEEDWSQALELLGIRASGRKTEYFLSQLPVENTLDVSIRVPTLDDPDVFDLVTYPRGFLNPDGELVDSEGQPLLDEAWYYVEGRNSIAFENFVPLDLSQVQITYVPRSSAVDIEPPRVPGSNDNDEDSEE